MRRSIVLFAVLLVCFACGDSDRREVCTSAGAGQLRCAIDNLQDCQAIRDYPYARNLFCPAAFSAAQSVASALSDGLGAAKPTEGFFLYYQTISDLGAPPDDQAQTTAACLDISAPWGGSRVVGAGTPLCHLIAYVSSPGPVGPGGGQSRNPVPADLRAFPQYFKGLYPPASASLLSEFRVGASFDPIVGNLGAAARDGFLDDYPSFSPDALYDPDQWVGDAQYHGISGGGGGGWGGEIGIERGDAEPVVLLAFGGGGGGGMTSERSFGVTSSRVGSGGGGGMQLGGGYRFGDRAYNGLGLGAGVGSDEDEPQYSYFDYEGSGRAAQPVHDYNPAVIADYQEQVTNLVAQLGAELASGGTVVLRGGGGMGAGAEYLMENGEELTPHALSTQAGFQFRYAFEPPSATRAAGRGLDVEQEDAYALLGEFYRRGTAAAYEECGRDYANFPCICPTAHAIVICMMVRELGDPTKVPAWLQQQHCPNDPALPNQPVDDLTSYQRVLLDSVSMASESGDVDPRGVRPSCRDALLAYFESLNSPTNQSCSFGGGTRAGSPHCTRGGNK